MALQIVEKSEHSVLRLLAAQSSTSTGSNTQSVIAQTPRAATTAMLLGTSLSNVTVRVGGTPAKVFVPEVALTAIYQQAASVKNRSADPTAGDAVLMLTALKDDVLDTLPNGPGPNGGSVSLAAAPVGINVVLSMSGEAVYVEGLSDALLVTVAFEALPGRFCVFWDEEARFWSTKGVTTLYASNGLQQCATSHLSLFALITEEFGKPLLCYDVKLGLRNLSKGSWASQYPALILWFLSTLLLLVILSTILIDKKSRIYYKWQEEYFFVTTEKEWLWNERETACFRLLCDAVEDIFTLVIDPANQITTTAATLSMSSQVGIYRKDMRKKLRQFGATADQEFTSGSEKMNTKMGYIRQKSLEQYLYFFDPHTSFCRRFCLIFGALQPWFTLVQFSFTPAAVRAQLLASRIFGALFMEALFYHLSGIAVGSGSDDECARAIDHWTVLRSALVGFVCALLSDLPVAVMAGLHSRGFKFSPHWNEAVIKRTVWRWMVEDYLLRFLLIAYNVFCALFVSVFLANVSSKSYTDWTLSALFAVIYRLIIGPLMKAFAITFLATLLACFCPKAVKRNAPVRESHAKKDVEEADAVANNQEAQQAERAPSYDIQKTIVIKLEGEESDSGASSESSIDEMGEPDDDQEGAEEEVAQIEESAKLEGVDDSVGELNRGGQMLPASCLTSFVTIPASAVNDTTKLPVSSLLPPSSLKRSVR